MEIKKLENFDVKACVAIIENLDGEFLLLKRGIKAKQQGWCLPGGGKDKEDNNPLDTAKRETWEETGLKIKKSKFEYVGIGVSIRGFNVGIFYAKLNKPKKIILSEEHSEYIWSKDYEKLDLAGNTGDYIKMINKLNLFESNHNDLDPWGEEDWDINNNELDIYINKYYDKIDDNHWLHKKTIDKSYKKNWLTYDQLSDSFIKRKAIIGG